MSKIIIPEKNIVLPSDKQVEIISKSPHLQEVINNADLLEERVLMWETNFLLWFWDCFWSKDEGSGKYRVAPRFEYLKSLHSVIENEDIESQIRLQNDLPLPDVYWIVKGRQLFVTWYMVARFLWKLMYCEDIRLVYGSRVEADVTDVIRTRFEQAYNSIDVSIPKPKLKFTSLRIENESRGTLLMGMSSSGDGSRGKTGAELWLDEIAFQKDQESLIRSSLESFNAVDEETLESVTKVIGVTTPNPKPIASYSKRLIGKSIDPNVKPRELSKHCIKYYNTKGHVVLSMPHWVHPDRQQEWAEAKILKIGQNNYDIEHNCNWDAQAGMPCFFGYSSAKHEKRLTFDSSLPLRIAVDPGTGHPAVVFFQKGRDGKCRVLHAFVRENVQNTTLCRLIEEIIKEKFESHGDLKFYIDPAGSVKNPQGSEICAVVIEQHFGVPCEAAPRTNPNFRIAYINNYFDANLIEIQQDCGFYYYQDGNVEVKAFTYMLESGYCKDKHNEPIKDGTWDHFADAFGYGFIMAFDITRDLNIQQIEGLELHNNYFDQLQVSRKKIAAGFLG